MIQSFQNTTQHKKILMNEFFFLLKISPDFGLTKKQEQQIHEKNIILYKN